MTDTFRTVPVPREIEAEVAILVEQIQAAAGPQAGFTKDDVDLIAPAAKHFGGADIAVAAFSASGLVLTWLTKAWVDKYVIPVILEKTDGKSRQFQEWLRSVLPGS